MDKGYILAINPGSTSTKIAVFKGNNPVFLKTIRHNCEELAQFKEVVDQFEFRKNLIIQEIKENSIPPEDIKIVIGRGGLIKPILSGVYEVNESMKNDLRAGILGKHASNLGGLIAADLCETLPDAKAYIADPVVVDELQDVARITGHPEIKRMSIFHALNQKATARTYAQSCGMKYEDLNLIIAHLGGGISIGAHKKGRVIDVNNALDGDGPFSPERSGSLPVGALADYCFNKGLKYENVKKMITGKGGLTAYTGSNDAHELEINARRGDKKAKLLQEAMGYQISKEIGAMAAVLAGEIHAIILTGGIANNPDLTGYIKEHVAFIAPVFIYPGEDEMRALAMNGLMLMKGIIKAKEYKEENFVKNIGLDL
ncbi:MAG TPA: butyrate kinase [Bacteroidales bacterium]|nr:butyrate kinase [Bacteroidales bacterium]